MKPAVKERPRKTAGQRKSNTTSTGNVRKKTPLRLPKLDVSKLRLPKLQLSKLRLPKLQLPKLRLPDIKKIEWNRETARRLLPLLFAILTIITCMTVLYAGDNVGLSDNGDFRRVLLANYMDFADDADNRYLFKDTYTMCISGDTGWQQFWSVFATSQDKVEYSSPHFVFIKISKLLNYWSNCMAGRPLNTYSLWWLALLYSLVLGAAAYLLVHFFEKMSSRIVAGLLFLLVFCDAGYILYFNSFYGEAVQYVTLLLLVGLLLRLFRKPKSYAALALFYIALYIFAGSKLANIPYAIVVGLSTLLLFLLEKNVRFRLILSGGVCITVISLIVLYTSIPSWMDYDTTYQSVFFGVLKSSQTPVQDLEELGIDPELAVLQNTHAYMNEYPVDIHSDKFEDIFYKKTGKVGVALFYLRHPVRLTEKLSLAIQNSASIRPPYLGNTLSVRMGQAERFSLWSGVRLSTRLLYTPGFVLPFLLLGTLLTLLVLLLQIHNRRTCNRRAMVASAFILLLLGGIWIAMAIPIIGNGEADLSKHMFLFISLLDLLVSILLAAFLLNFRAIAAFLLKKSTRDAIWRGLCAIGRAISAVGRAISRFVRMIGRALYRFGKWLAAKCQPMRNTRFWLWLAKYITPKRACAICVIICLIVVCSMASRPDTFQLGTFNGKPIVWEVIAKNPDGSVQAVSKQVLAAQPFDVTGEHGSNLWSESSLRRWLNGTFLNQFTEKELSRLQPMNNRILLSIPYTSRSEGGNHPHFWTGVPNTAASLGETAYYETVTDKVSLLTLEAYQRGGFRRAAGKPYWLIDPYTDNGEMVRYADNHGFSIYCDANRTLGVRPVITVK